VAENEREGLDGANRTVREAEVGVAEAAREYFDDDLAWAGNRMRDCSGDQRTAWSLENVRQHSALAIVLEREGG